MEQAEASNGPLGYPKDRDPPPLFDGSNPDLLKQYFRGLELWQWETDVPKKKHAVKVIRQLSGSARSAADEVSIADIRGVGGAIGSREAMEFWKLRWLRKKFPC